MLVQQTAIDPSLNAYFVQPDTDGPWPAVVLFTEGLGLNSDMLEGSLVPLAQAGIFAVAPDIFHGDVFDGSDRDAMLAKIRSINDDEVLDEAQRTILWLGAQDGVDETRVGGIGFCMGGRLAFLAHAALGLGASACFYGGGIAPQEDRLGRKPVLDRVPEMQGPVFLGYGAEDTGITPDEHARIVQALSAAKKRFEFQLFPDAGHAFMSPSRPSYAPERAAEAWPLVTDFFRRSL